MNGWHGRNPKHVANRGERAAVSSQEVSKARLQFGHDRATEWESRPANHGSIIRNRDHARTTVSAVPDTGAGVSAVAPGDSHHCAAAAALQSALHAHADNAASSSAA